MIEQRINETINDFLGKYKDKCTGELSTLAFFHLFFFDILKEKLAESNIEIERKTIISNHIDKSPIFEFSYDNEINRCEFGDLFLICDLGKYKKAVVIQAKFNPAGYNSTSTWKEQLLYENWPEFKITKPENAKPKVIKERYKFNHKIGAIARFLTFFQNEDLIFRIGDLNNSIRFSNFFEELIDYNNINTGRLFKTTSELRKIKIVNTLFGIEKCKCDDDDWDIICNWVKDYFKKRNFTNIKTGLNNKQKITELCFLDGSSPENIDHKILLNDELSVRNEGLEFFSLIKITSHNTRL